MEVDTIFRTLQTLELPLINKTVRETLNNMNNGYFS